jgi:hypothetical protein
MTRTVHPPEILVSVCILVVLAAGLFGGGYCLGHSGQANYNEVRDELEQSYGREAAEARLRYEETLSVNVDCRGDESDWATIRMANEIGFNADIPVFVHGNCLTHEVVDFPSITLKGGMLTCSGNMTAYECGEYVKKRFDAELINTRYCDSDTGKCSDGTRVEITNVPQPEGQ